MSAGKGACPAEIKHMDRATKASNYRDTGPALPIEAIINKTTGPSEPTSDRVQDLVVDTLMLESLADATIFALVSDKDLREQLTKILRHGVTLFAANISRLKEAFEAARLDSTVMNETERERFQYLADELDNYQQPSILLLVLPSHLGRHFSRTVVEDIKSFIDRSQLGKAIISIHAQLAAKIRAELQTLSQ
jgi:hypothetical protein